MADSLSFPGDLAECHRLMAQQQALFAALEQQRADLEQVLDRTTKDFGQLQEAHQKAIDEVRLLRRWIYGSRRERHVADAKQQHLFEMSELFAEPAPSEEQSSLNGEVGVSGEDAARAAVAQEKAARRRKKRADRKLCLDALVGVSACRCLQWLRSCDSRKQRTHH